MPPLISVQQLAHRLDRVTLLDVRWQLGSDTGRSEYAVGHLPRAAFVDLDRELSAPVREDRRGGRHPMPATRDFQAAMRRAGVSGARPVVCYDAGNGLPASRAWWLLRYFGKDDVQVLDGGLASWVATGRPVEAGVHQPAEGDFTADPGHRRLLDADAAAAHPLLLDARPAARFRGEQETIDPVAGHIPGARSAPALDSLQAGRFLQPAALAAYFAAIGVRPGADVAVYCGSGVQAAHAALALQHAGVTDDAAVYVGSWSDWVSDPTRPVETG
ncbi:MAG TPA: rhodanese-like domain-containing protein [Dermatophilaceae bacterium]|nr:rhodanese-like domain-containing protein [Dermatophilaceae bacterium]